MRAYLLVSSSLFAVVAAGHLVRAALGLELLVDGASFPIAASWIGGVFAATLSSWGFRLAARARG